MTFQFLRNEDRSDIYDLIDGPDTSLTYVRLSKPVKGFLLKNRAAFVLESWKENQKILFTGLIPISNNTYKGDHWRKSKGLVHELRVTISKDLNKLSIEVMNTKKKGPNR